MAFEQKLDLVSPQPQQDWNWLSGRQPNNTGVDPTAVTSGLYKGLTSPTGFRSFGTQRPQQMQSTPVAALNADAPPLRELAGMNKPLPIADANRTVNTSPVAPTAQYAPDQMRAIPKHEETRMYQPLPVDTHWGTSPEGNTLVTGGYTPNPYPVTSTIPARTEQVTDLGRGNTLGTPTGMIRPEQQAVMRNIIAQDSDPNAIARRARDAAQAATNAAPKEPQSIPSVPTGGGSVGGGQPDYSGVIDQAIATLQSNRPSGSFDRQIEWKNKVGAAKDILGLVGGMQTSANQTAAQQGIAGMNNATDRQRIAAGQEEARQRTALGGRELDIKEGQSLIDAQNMGMQRQAEQQKLQQQREQADIDNQRMADQLGISKKDLGLRLATFERENQKANIAEQETARNQALRTDILRNQRRGMFGGISPEDELMAQAGGSGAVPLDYFLQKQK